MIEKILAKDFRGIRKVEMDLSDAKIHVIQGPHRAGKTSILEAVRVALTGRAASTSKKKDAARLTRHGAKGFRVAVTVGGEEVWRTISSASHSVTALRGVVGVTEDQLLAVLDAGRWWTLDETARRQLLAGALGKRMTAEEIAEGLDEVLGDEGRGVAKIARGEGWKAAIKHCITRRAEASRAVKSAGDVADPEDPEIAGMRASEIPLDAAEAQLISIRRERDETALEFGRIECARSREAVEHEIAVATVSAENLAKELDASKAAASTEAELRDASNAARKEVTEAREKEAEAVREADRTGALVDSLETMVGGAEAGEPCGTCGTDLGDEAIRGKVVESLRTRLGEAAKDHQAAVDRVATAAKAARVAEKKVESAEEAAEAAAPKTTPEAIEREIASVETARDKLKIELEALPAKGALEKARATMDALAKRIEKGEAVVRVVRGYRAAVDVAKSAGTVEAAQARWDMWDAAVKRLPELEASEVEGGGSGFRERLASNGVALGLDVTLSEDLVVEVCGVPEPDLSGFERAAVQILVADAVASTVGIGLLIVDEMSAVVGEEKQALQDLLISISEGYERVLLVGARGEKSETLPPSNGIAQWWVSGGEVAAL